MLYALSGLFVGIVVGLTGVGGGSLMTPILVLLFGVHPATAVGTDLLYAAATKSVGTAVHGFNRTVIWRVTGLLALGSAPTSVAMIYLLNHFGPYGAGASTLITTILGCALLLTAAAMALRRRIQAYAATRAGRLDPAMRAVLTVLTGVALGVFVSLSSVGAGALGVTALILLYPEAPTSQIVGSDIAHAVPLTLVAGLGHWLIGSVNFETLGMLLIGSIPGIVIGSFLTPRLPDQWLRTLLAIVLAVVGARLVVP
ncbi:MAG: sulfite exporter TauE/SafE family protein [Roseiarcus sp.]